MNTTQKLTAAQTKNLEIIRANGGKLVRRNFTWFVPSGNTPIRGLNGNAIKNLEAAGLVRCLWVGGFAVLEVV